MVFNFGMFFVVAVNLFSFLLVWHDKRKAIRSGWRVKENRFFLLALLGGAIGVYIGMETFRHKTKHNVFKYGIPVMIFLNLIVFLAVLIHLL